MEKLDAMKPATAEDLFESIRETRVKVNELIAERDALVGRIDIADKALMKMVGHMALHKHTEATGESVMPLAI